MDAPRKYVVRLTPEQRDRLTTLTRTGSAPVRKLTHARVLLLADADHPEGPRPDAYIADAVGMHGNGVARIRKRFALFGEAQHRTPRGPRRVSGDPVTRPLPGQPRPPAASRRG